MERKSSRAKVIFIFLINGIACFALWRCGPGVSVSSPPSSVVCSGTSVFGVNGTANCVSADNLLGSNIYRTVGTPQITQSQEVTTYAGSSGVSLPSGFRETSDIENDDDGLCNADAIARGLCLISNSFVTWAQHVNSSSGGGMVNCGTSQNTVAARISDCAKQNPSLSTWNPIASGNIGLASWKLVTRNTPFGTCTSTPKSCRPVEVWQDQRTGLLWSSLVAGNTTAGGHATDNWCHATGNQQSTTVSSGIPWPTSDPYGRCNSGTYQDQTSPTSYCAENSVYGPPLSPVLGTENWYAGTYDLAKGGMGYLATPSSPSVRWRLPTLHDYLMSEIDGIRFVLPDMGSLYSNSEWTATVSSFARGQAYYFKPYSGFPSGFFRYLPFAVRCVGR
jgi:hypothetical protein